MKLAVSNLAWSLNEDIVKLSRLFNRYDVRRIELAESKKNFHELLQNNDVVSMQSILFGHKENLFGSQTERDCLMTALKKKKSIAKSLGCFHIVFGCPSNRRMLSDRSTRKQIEEASSFFKELADYLPEVIVGFEPVSIRYNCNFVNDFNAAVQFVKLVDHPSFMVNLDLANVHDSDITIDDIKRNLCYVSHIHISETDLSEIRTAKILKELIEHIESNKELDDRLVFSIEAKDLTFEQLERSIKFIKSFSKHEER